MLPPLVYKLTIKCFCLFLHQKGGKRPLIIMHSVSVALVMKVHLVKVTVQEGEGYSLGQRKLWWSRAHNIDRVTYYIVIQVSFTVIKGKKETV